MKYEGMLYGRVAGKYVRLDRYASEFDAFEDKIKELEFEAMERRADLQDLEKENDTYAEGEESARKELTYCRDQADEFQRGMVKWHQKFQDESMAHQETKEQLALLKIVKAEFLDKIDELRLGICQVKEMLEEDHLDFYDNFDVKKAIRILETALHGKNYHDNTGNK